MGGIRRFFQVKGFRNRILVLFLSLFLAVEVGFFYAISAVYLDRAEGEITFELETTGSLFQTAIHNRLVPLGNASYLISKDYAFQKAFATRHSETVVSAMSSLKERVNADFMLLLGIDDLHPVLYELPKTDLSGNPFPFPDLIESAEDRGGPLTTFFVLKGKLFSTIILPLLAPEPLAWICLGFQIDDGFAGSYRKLTHSDLSIFRSRNGVVEVLASTLKPEARELLSRYMETNPLTMEVKRVTIGSERTVIQMNPLDPATNLYFVLQQSLDEALAPHSKLFRILSVISFTGILLSVFLVVLLFNRMTKPLSEMIEVVTRFQGGDWSARVKEPAEDEIGQLAMVFNGLAEEVVQSQASLEARVTERTSELEQARQKAEHTLRDLAASTQSLNLLSRAIENCSATVIITDSDAVIEFVNPAFTKKTGYLKEEAIGRNPRLLKSGKTPPEVYQRMWDRLTHGETWTGELCTRKKNGELFWESVSINPVIGTTGTRTHFVAVKEDVTERRELQEVLRHAKEEAQAASQAKSQFLANMSHEIRTPMNAVIGYSFLVQKLEMPAEVREYVTKIQNSGAAVLSLINDILDLSKIEAGKLTLETHEFSLEEVLTQASDVVFGEAVQKGLEFFFSVPPDIPTILVGDRVRLSQVLVNLATNAVKFTEKGEVELSIQVLDRTPGQIKLRFSVRDTGIGLSEEQQGRLFHAFTQADGSTTRKYGGTGLGLNISKKLVELMSGEIAVESELGRGSTFFFSSWFGLGTAIEQDTAAFLRGARILIATGNAGVWNSLRRYFEVADAFSVVVGSGQEAVDLVKNQDETNPFHLVFLDSHLPDRQGVEVARFLKESSALQHPPPIALIATGDDSTLLRLVRDRVVELVIPKPLTPSKLLNSVLRILAPHLQKLTQPVSKEGNWAEHLRGARVLLTEDNQINQEIASELLKQAGVIVEVAGNGRQAVEMVTNSPVPFDLVLMDVQMPEMDGLEATRKIRGDPRFARLPIIAMTAHVLAEDRKKCTEAGMNDHIVKPIEVNAMFETLVRWYANRSSRAVDDVVRGVPLAVPIQATPNGIFVPGLNVREGVNRVGGNETLYWKLVRRFAEEQGTTCSNIAAAIGKEDIQAAEELIHTVKGVAGNLGAEGLHAVARDLERAVAGNDPPENTWTTFKSFEETLGRLIANIRGAIPGAIPDQAIEKPVGSFHESAPDGTLPGNAAAIEDLPSLWEGLSTLANYLATSDSEMIGCFQQLQGDLRKICQPREFQELNQAFNAGDFDRALEVLRGVTDRLEIRPPGGMA